MTTIEIPDGSLFGLDNLPYGVFSTPGTAPRVGVRVGDSVVDLAVALGDDVFAAADPERVHGPGLPAMGGGARADHRARLRVTCPTRPCTRSTRCACTCRSRSRDYVDFYASEHHATNLGRLFRPGAPSR